MAAAAMTGKTQCRSQLPSVNLFDIPEMMPGAESRATPAQRLEFETRCIKLHEDEMEAQRQRMMSAERASVDADAAAVKAVDELEKMFPSLDPALVRVLAADAPTPQHAMETLLALIAAEGEPGLPALPPKDLGLTDTDAFPSLVDADGWELPSQLLFDRNPDEDLGSAWRDRAKAAAAKPAPPPAAAAAVRIAAKKHASKQDEVGEAAHPETDYEFRQRLGKKRISNRARFPRARRGTATAGNGDSQAVDTSSEEEEEEARGVDTVAA